jgi:hypothetical protein
MSEYKVFTYYKASENYRADTSNWVVRGIDVPSGEPRVERFHSRDALYAHVRKYDYFASMDGKAVVLGNRFLDAVITNPRDNPRHMVESTIGPKMRKPEWFGVLLGYLVKDDKGRIIDLRNYAYEINKFNVDLYNSELQKIREAEWAEWRAAQAVRRNARWERYDKLTEGKPYWGYYRRIRTTQEKRYAAIKEHKP